MERLTILENATMMPANQVLSLTLRQTEARSTNSGYHEQWQRALEKAYFEKQMDTMRNSGAGNTDEEGTLQITEEVTAVEIPFNGSAQWSNVQANVVQRDTFQNAALYEQRHRNQKMELTPLGTLELTKTSASESVLLTSTRLPLTLLSQGGSQSQAALQTNSYSLTPSSTMSATQTAVAMENMLPSPSSVKAFATAQGTHIVIRDLSLGASSILQLLTRIRSLLAENGQHLLTIILNGERILNNSERPLHSSERKLNELERSGAQQQQIDFLF